VSRFGQKWSDLTAYLVAGSVEDLSRTQGYMERLEHISNRLLTFTEQELQAHEFLNAAEANFKSLNFSIISALGTEPQEGRLAVAIVPRRILDPLLWVLEKSFTGSERLYHRWWEWLTGEGN
jgi:hypothetical protein